MARKSAGRRFAALLMTALLVLSAAVSAYAEGRPEIEPYGIPWINSNVYGMVTEKTERPEEKDDFYVAVNYDWMKDTELKAGYTSAGTLDDISDLVDERIAELMTDESLSGREAELVREYYQMFLDWDARKESKEVYLAHLKPIQEIKTLEDLSAYLVSDEAKYYGKSIVEYGIGEDLSDSDSYALYISPTELVQDDSAEYAEETSAGSRKRAVYSDMGKYMLKYAGYSEAEASDIVEKSYAFEAALAPSIMTNEELGAEDAIERQYNIRTLGELEAASPAFPLVDILKASGYNLELAIDLEQPAWLEALNGLYTEENLENMRAYLLFNQARSFIRKVDEEAYREYQRLVREYNGTDESREDEYEAMSEVNDTLWQFVDEMYVQKYCSEKMKQDVLNIMKEVVQEYKKMLREENWLSEETREKAIEKLDALKLYSAYPDKREDWSSVSFASRSDGGSLIEANLAINRALSELSQAESFGKPDKDLWLMPASAVNAYYSPTGNSITILGGILNGAAYNEEMSEEEKLGAIGMIIGHEISHAFDSNTGSLFDAKGSFNEWWTEEDRAAFSARAKKLIDYFDAISPWKSGEHYSGTIVQGEAIADLGGIACMLRIAAEKENFDYDAFFRAYARLWSSVMTENLLESIYQYNEHPLEYLRVNATLAQFEEFRNVYGVKPGDGMYVAPEEIIAIWGVGTSDEPLSRAQAISLLWEQAGKPKAGTAAASFTDVSEDSDYNSALLWAAGKGIAKGTGDGIFSPDSVCTREQAATFVYRYIQSEGGGFEGLWSFPLSFSDAEDVSAYAYEALCWLTMNNAIDNAEGAFSPRSAASRAFLESLMD